jgi:1,4-dihydroxy-6-naphthoate synthase
MKPLSLGFSPCPNDTFIFSALVKTMDQTSAPLFAKPLLEDVETLNRWALEHRLDVTKLSFHALGHVLAEYCVLQTGSALGRGCGPLLVAPSHLSIEQLTGCTIAIPGKYTTAALLFSMFLPDCKQQVEMSFEHIMDAVQRGEVDAGVIIHESRFTYQRYDLVCLQDLGQWWEDTSGLPIPLGCIAAKRSLGAERIKEIEHHIRSSLETAYANPEACMEYVRVHAQETEDEVIQSHIDLYVNHFSVDLGAEGRAAIEAFVNKGRAEKALPHLLINTFCQEC